MKPFIFDAESMEEPKRLTKIEWSSIIEKMRQKDFAGKQLASFYYDGSFPQIESIVDVDN